MKHLLLFLLAFVSPTVFAAEAPRSSGTYQYSKQINVSGPGGWDYLSVDAQARRLYLSHSSKVVVINLDQGTVEGEVSDTFGVHGFALAPELGQQGRGTAHRLQ